jgi:phosphopantetheinyl transferase (holo-ACP synthase)
LTSVGNDIIDLSAVDSQRSADFKFYSKFLTKSEQDLCQNVSEDISIIEGVWLLWSIKESVYKYLKRYQPQLIFSPIGIVVRQINIPTFPLIIGNESLNTEIANHPSVLYTGNLSAGNETLHFRSTIQFGFISTIVDKNAVFENVYWGVSRIHLTDQASQSDLVRSFTLAKLKEICSDGLFSITKTVSGYPIILNHGVKTDIILSLAHHSRFVSYCFKKHSG